MIWGLGLLTGFIILAGAIAFERTFRERAELELRRFELQRQLHANLASADVALEDFMLAPEPGRGVLVLGLIDEALLAARERQAIATQAETDQIYSELTILMDGWRAACDSFVDASIEMKTLVDLELLPLVSEMRLVLGDSPGPDGSGAGPGGLGTALAAFEAQPDPLLWGQVVVALSEWSRNPAHPTGRLEDQMRVGLWPQLLGGIERARLAKLRLDTADRNQHLARRSLYSFLADNVQPYESRRAVENRADMLSVIDTRDKLFIGTLVAAFLAVWLTAQRLLRPSERMRQQVLAIDPQRGDQLALEQGYPKDFVELGRSINGLVEEIGRRRDEADALNQGLRQKNANQARMFAVIGHQLRTPAAAIAMQLEAPGAPEERLAGIRANVTRLLRVIGELRQAVNPDEDVPVEIAAFDLAGLLIELEKSAAPMLIASGMAMRLVRPEPTGLRYLSDEFRIHSLLMALVRNATQHSGGHEVVVTISDSPLGETRRHLVFAVEDDGKGLDEAARGVLFERFNTEASNGGMGLGLHLAKRWAGRLGGDLAFALGEAGGARFEFTLDVDVASDPVEADAMAADLLERVAPALRGKRLLLVEDEALLARVTRSVLLKSFDLEVDIAGDGAEALRMFSSAEYQLVLTDYFMPHIDGAELIRELRRQGQRLPILAISAATIGDEHDELLAAGADTVLAKPLAISAFVAEIATLLDAGRLT